MHNSQSQVLQRFLHMVQVAKDHNSKEIRMSTSDAHNLALSLAQMLVSERDLSQKIMQLQDQLIAQTTVQPQIANLSGGSFT